MIPTIVAAYEQAAVWGTANPISATVGNMAKLPPHVVGTDMDTLNLFFHRRL
jgi:hypothetical protein